MYDAFYFQNGCGLPYERSEYWTRAFARMADQIVAGIGPGSVLDAGCAMGFLVEALRDRGVEAYGCDISEYALSQARADIRPFCWQASVLDPLPRRYDLIVCIEVLEHLPPADAPQAVANFCEHADEVLFSSTPSDFRETSHVNVRPVEYWAELFARHNFFRDVDFDATFILPWSARFRRMNEPVASITRNYERKFWWMQNQNHELREQLRLQTTALRSRIEQLETDAARREHLLAEIRGSLSWRLLQVLGPIRRFAIPRGSRRERAALKVFGGQPKAPQPGHPAGQP